MRFALRYWTRRSAATIAIPCDGDAAEIARTARCLRGWAAEHEWRILGEAFLRHHGSRQRVLHLPVDLGEASPCPPIRVGRIDHGRVVAAYEVAQQDAQKVARALVAQLHDRCLITGPVEFHFDPSVGRTEGIVVVPVSEHPDDKAAYVSVRGAVTG